MKQNIFQTLALTAMSVSLLASCSSDSELTPGGGTAAEQIVRVTTNVNDIQTRSIYETSNLKEFGMSIINANSDNYTYNNVKWTKGSGNKWSPASTMLWQSAAHPVTVVAYAPYQADATAPIHTQTAFPFSVSSNQKPDSDHSDLIVYKKTGLVPQENWNENKELNIEFSHLLSQLTVKVKFTGNEFEEHMNAGVNPISDFKIHGTKLAAKVDFTGNEVSVVADGSEGFVIPRTLTDVNQEDFTVLYSAVLVPQEIAASTFGVNIEAAGKQYSWKSSSAITLESGKAYTLEFTLGKNKITASPISVSGWGAGGALTGGEVGRSEADQIKLIMKEAMEAGKTDIDLTLSRNADADVFKNIRAALMGSDVANGSINLTIHGATQLPESAFESVTSLKKVNMPDIVDVGKSAFANCTNIEEMELKKSQNLAEECFANCTSLTKLTFGFLVSLVYSDEENAEGNCFKNVETVNIALVLHPHQQVLVKGNENIWKNGSKEYKNTTEYKERKFAGMQFKSVSFYAVE